MSVPSCLADFTVQLIHSDGGVPQYRERLWEFFTIALTPFVLGVPPEQVRLIITDQFRGFSSKVLQQENDDIMVDDTEIMPAGYKDYFESVYHKAETIDALPLCSCSLRVITGHGFGNFKGGNIMVGGQVVRYPGLGENATCLTILDICNAPYAVAHLDSKIPPKNKWYKFDKSAVFAEGISVPVICDKNDALWAFRVGYQGQHADDSVEKLSSNRRMSKPVGDSIAASLLFSIKLLNESDSTTSLDQFFYHTYTALNTELLSNDADHPNPHSSLGIMQSLVDTGVLPLNAEAFDSLFFRLQQDWFLTMERAVALTDEDSDVAAEIITFIVDSIVTWYSRHDAESWCDAEFPTEWETLLNMMGPFRSKLKSVKLAENRNGGGVVVTEKGGLPLEAWGSSCGDLPGILSKVRRKVVTGFFDEDQLKRSESQ
jgi:hypothetical protein